MRFVVFADLHLDAAFAWARPETARRRRQALRDVLRRVLALAEAERADAVLCAGDLYEHDRFSPDTREFLRRELGEAGRDVYLAPGNHDFHGPASLYAQVSWPEHVKIFTNDRLTAVTLADGLTLWGAAFLAPSRTTGFLGDFRVERGGAHLALFHGSERSGLAAELGKSPHAPFGEADLERAGLDHAFVGHYHQPRDGQRHTYPGNPEPLVFGETGLRGAVVADVDPDGSVIRRRHAVAVTEVHDLALDVTGCRSFEDVRKRAVALLAGRAGCARLTLEGELDAEAALDIDGLREVDHGLDELVVRIGALRPGHDIETLRGEQTVRGEFVRRVLAGAQQDDDLRRRILLTGLRALQGRDDLEVP